MAFAVYTSPMSSKRLVAAVPCKSLRPIHALSTPVAVCPVIRHPTDFVPEASPASGFTLGECGASEANALASAR
jgi:hypothetical protein